MILIFVGTQNPKEGLNVDHVSRLEIAQVAFNRLRKLKKTGIRAPRRARMILKIKTVCLGRDACDFGLKKDLSLRLCNEPEHCQYRPSEDSGLLSGKRSDHIVPRFEPTLLRSR